MNPTVFRVRFKRDRVPSKEEWMELYDALDATFLSNAMLNIRVQQRLAEPPWLYFAQIRTALQMSVCPMCGSIPFGTHTKQCVLWNIWKEMDSYAQNTLIHR